MAAKVLRSQGDLDQASWSELFVDARQYKVSWDRLTWKPNDTETLVGAVAEETCGIHSAYERVFAAAENELAPLLKLAETRSPEADAEFDRLYSTHSWMDSEDFALLDRAHKLEERLAGEKVSRLTFVAQRALVHYAQVFVNLRLFRKNPSYTPRSDNPKWTNLDSAQEDLEHARYTRRLLGRLFGSDK